MASIRSWKETTGVDLFLIDITEEEKSRGPAALSTIFLNLEDEISTRVRELACTNAYIGANADDDEHDFMEFLVSKEYKNILTMADMKVDLNKWEVGEILRDTAPTVEKLLPDNVEQIWSLNNVVYSGREYIPVLEEDDHQEFISKILSEKSVCHVARLDDEVVGFVWAVSDNESAEILEVSILDEYRRRGIARLLLGKVLAALKSRGVKDVWLETNADNLYGARSLYSSLGFIATKRHLRFRKPVLTSS